MKKRPRFQFVFTAFASLILMFGLIACGSSGPATTVDEPVTTQEAPSHSKDLGDSKPTGISSSSSEGSDESFTAEDVQRVGTNAVGWVDVPANWVEFIDVAGGDDVQFSDPTGTRIVTMNTFDMSSVPEEDRSDFTAMDAAYNVWANLENSGMNDGEGATVELAGKTAYQVYGTYDDGTFLVAWCVEDDAGVIHYLCIEGPAETFLEDFERTESTYSFTN